VTPDEAAWVREHAWTEQMRQQPYFLEGTSTVTYDHAEAAARCLCMAGVCSHCRSGRHQCQARFKPRRPPEWWLAGIPVRIAGYPCRSLCPCICPAASPKYELVALFDAGELLTSPR
jgi:uncharacterized protein DUF6248